MATLTNIDRTRAVTFTPHITTDKVPDGLPDWLPSHLTRAVPGETLEISPPQDGQRHFLDWLVETGWVSKVERDLQCLCETEKGERLLTSWMELDEFAALAADATCASMMPSMEEAIARWREQDVTDVFFDGYEAVDAVTTSKNIELCELQTVYYGALLIRGNAVWADVFDANEGPMSQSEVALLARDIAQVSGTAATGGSWRSRPIHLVDLFERICAVHAEYFSRFEQGGMEHPTHEELTDLAGAIATLTGEHTVLSLVQGSK